MDTVLAFRPLALLMLAAAGCVFLVCAVLYVVRARSLPRADPLYAFACGAFAFAVVPTSNSPALAGVLLFLSGFAAWSGGVSSLAALRSAAVLQQALKAPVLVLCGRAGTGKSMLLARYMEAHPGRLKVLAPEQLGEPLDAAKVSWGEHQALALDEVGMWARTSLPDAVAELEATAAASGKQLVLVTQSPRDVANLGITLEREPVIVELSMDADQPIVTMLGGRAVRYRNRRALLGMDRN